MNTRESLLEVTAELFAEYGWRGTTTRMISAAAGVNEVTIFRNFGTKEALLLEAIQGESVAPRRTELPAQPTDVRSELLTWAHNRHRLIAERRAMIRTCLAEFGEHPELGPVACDHARLAIVELVRYFESAQRLGLIGATGSLETATIMLMNAIFVTAITGDIMADPDREPVATRIEQFVDLILAGLSKGGA